eukprot:3500859-Prymnesium_polylepis.1
MAAEDSRKPRPDVLVPTDCCLRFTDTVARSAILALSCVGRLVRHAARRINTRMYIHTLARAKLCPSSREKCGLRAWGLGRSPRKPPRRAAGSGHWGRAPAGGGAEPRKRNGQI